LLFVAKYLKNEVFWAFLAKLLILLSEKFSKN
jgi:hypothetical protein